MIIIGLTFAVALSLTASETMQAQSPQRQLMVAVTPYQQLQKLDFFFEHSVYSLGYYDGNAVQPSVFLSMITPEQKEEYIKNGYQPKIIDDNAGDVIQYYEIRDNQGVNQYTKLTDSTYRQQGLELVYPLTPHITLIKLTKGIEYSQLTIPYLKNYKEIQFTGSISRPDEYVRNNLRESIGMGGTNTLQKSKSPSPAAVGENEKNSWRFFMAFIVLLIIIGTIAYTFSRKKRSS